MYLISTNQSPDEAFAFCELWLETLGRGDFRAACDLIVPDGRHRWTPELIGRLIGNYGRTDPPRSGTQCVVTPTNLATGALNLGRFRVDEDDDVCTGHVHPRYPFAVYWFLDGPAKNGSVGWLHLDYPLDGEWSDLSSIFNIVPRMDKLALDLERIEVM